ncbi:MAG: ribosome biogenesis GTP-binding protein YihA/YsxC, partial [Eubacterium sp.]|nr:ribosome biogenesis GTP-binding protein YihA/YsxC [Eubacterium sp.]
MNFNKSEFDKAFGISQQLPKSDKPEIAFAGRSNVGKSSLINSLLNRKSLARVSSAPGKTITVNFYEIDGKIFFVDLPGYGYAARGKDQRQAFIQMIEGYALRRPQLACLFVLIDVRHEPQKID